MIRFTGLINHTSSLVAPVVAVQYQLMFDAIPILIAPISFQVVFDRRLASDSTSDLKT